MDAKVRDEMIEKSRELILAATCSAEAKAAAKRWIKAAGTAEEPQETERYIRELEADIMPIGNLIAFAQSEKGKAYFGPDAEGIAAHAQAIQAAGGRYCDCPACTAVAAILEKKDQMLG